jgi:hypothetical protein
LDAAKRYASGKLVTPENTKALLEAVIRPGDRVCLEGDNQKQADFLAETLASVDPSRVHDLHIIQTALYSQHILICLTAVSLASSTSPIRNHKAQRAREH